MAPHHCSRDGVCAGPPLIIWPRAILEPPFKCRKPCSLAGGKPTRALRKRRKTWAGAQTTLPTRGADAAGLQSRGKPLQRGDAACLDIADDGARTCAGSPALVWRIMRAFVLPIDSHLIAKVELFACSANAGPYRSSSKSR